MLNVDTHVLLYALTGTLRPRERRVLGADQWSISGIVLWEIAKLAQLGRISIDLEDPDVVRVLARIHVWPLTREIAHGSPCVACCAGTHAPLRAVVARLRAELQAHDLQMAKPLWPALLEEPIRIDVPADAPWKPGQEYVYWPN